jgi:two-component system response regulator AlgR
VKVLIVDQDPAVRERLTALVGEIGGYQVVGQAGSGPEAVRLTAATGAEVLLLDVHMPGMDGVEVATHLARLARAPAVIFTAQGSGVSARPLAGAAIDCLVKTVPRQQLAEALARARQLTRAQAERLAGERPSVRTHVSATRHGRLQLVPLSEVRCLVAEHKYVTAAFPGGELLLEDSLTRLEAELGDHFLRVHRNALVAPRHVETLERAGGGAYRIRLRGVPMLVNVSRRLSPCVRARLRRHG